MPLDSRGSCDLHGRGAREASAHRAQAGLRLLGHGRRDHPASAEAAKVAVATLIDASILIAAKRGRLDWDRVLAEHAAEETALAAITASEILHGVHRAPSARTRTRRDAFVEQLLTKLPVIPFDLLAARVHARVWAELAAKGVGVGVHDLLIGATALAIGGRVATRDLRSFPRIPGLEVTHW